MGCHIFSLMKHTSSWPGLIRPSTSLTRYAEKGVDTRDKRGHDDGVVDAPEYPLDMQKGGWVYIMTNRRNGTLYLGVTSDLARRAWQHREGRIDGFTKQYGLKYLVYYERFEDIRDAIQREKTMKHWPRAWKVRLIHSMNPNWDDLYETLNQ
jgi:putative endonuclease